MSSRREIPILTYRKLTPNATTPTLGSSTSAGYDLHSAYDVVVSKRDVALVKTDLQLWLPRGTYGRIAPRSGLALYNSIDVGGGVVDPDYRGNVAVVLFNHSDMDFMVRAGDRIAQLICERCLFADLEEYHSDEEEMREESPGVVVPERGDKGFGSTGRN